jgi:hypothetical protein
MRPRIAVRVRPSLAAIARRLTPDELALYASVIDPELSRRVTLVQLPVIPGPYSGLTVVRLVVVDRVVAPAEPSSLLAHELVHVRQFHQRGLLRFTWDYNRAFLTGLVRLRSWPEAYRAIPAEVEARREASRWAGELASRAARPQSDGPRPWGRRNR